MYTFLIICMYAILYNPTLTYTQRDSARIVKSSSTKMDVLRVKARSGANSQADFYIIDDKPVDGATYHKYLLKKQHEQQPMVKPVK